MRTLVFVGPSLPTADRPALDVEWHPPAAAGDLIRLLPDPPACLVLIDGYFDWRPAVWHKEILLLMAAGTRILGAASMGALRAAELDRYGMEGVGAIYRAYRDGRLSGDDEVALVHAQAEAGWKPVSEPLVDVRASLCRAMRARTLSASAARALLAAARAIHFSERDWPLILKSAGWPASDQLPSWLTEGIVRQKQRDALECLARAMRSDRRTPAPPPIPITSFIRTLAAELGVEAHLPSAAVAKNR